MGRTPTHRRGIIDVYLIGNYVFPKLIRYMLEMGLNKFRITAHNGIIINHIKYGVQSPHTYTRTHALLSPLRAYKPAHAELMNSMRRFQINDSITPDERQHFVIQFLIIHCSLSLSLCLFAVASPALPPLPPTPTALRWPPPAPPTPD